MTLSFDPDTLALDARHFIGGEAITGAPGMALRRPSDGAASSTPATSRALRAMKRIEAGAVWFNRCARSHDHILPTGGYKASGLGKDLGREACHANRRSKSVLIDIGEAA